MVQIKIRLLKEWNTKKVGDIISMAEDGAMNAVEQGVAELVKEETTKEVAEIKKEEKIEKEAEYTDHPTPEKSKQESEPKKESDEPDPTKYLSMEQVLINQRAVKLLIDKLKDENEIAQDLATQLYEQFCDVSQAIDDQKQGIEDVLIRLKITKEDFKKELKRAKHQIKKEEEKEEKGEVDITESEFLKLDNFQENAIEFYDRQPYFFDDTEVFWIWKDNRWEIVDETDISRTLDKRLGFLGQTISSGIKNNHLTAMKWYGREKKPTEAPKKWIQFKDKAFSIESKEIHIVTKSFFFCNPIPYEIGETDETPTMDKLFKEWVGEKYVETLYEIIAYCCLPDYPIQTLFCLYGNGRNGKSCFLKLLAKFIGKDNVCSTELDLIVGNNSSRFETAKLYKKLVCQMGETNFGVLNKSSIIKKLVGGDMLGFEMKGKKPFDEYNYAKILIASNSLPSSDDTSDGYYRRWLIIDFPNQFPEGKDILLSIPEQEYKNLARKCINILPKLMERGSFTNQGTISERQHKYIMASNPLPQFIRQYCDVHFDNYVRYSEFYTIYAQFLVKNKRRRVMMKEFGTLIAEEGYEVRKTSKQVSNNVWQSDRWIEGISLKKDIEFSHEIIIKPPKEAEETQKKIIEEDIDEEVEEKPKENILFKCKSCGAEPSTRWSRTGEPLCEVCYFARKKNGLE